MRKFLLTLIMFMQLINVSSLYAYADDKEYNYTVFYNWVSKSGGSEFVDTFNMSLTSTTQFVAYWGIKHDQYVLMLKPYELSTVLSDDVVFSSGGLSGYSANFDMTYEYKRDGKVVATLHNVNGVGAGVLMWEHSRRNTPSFFDDEILNTNIPIFHTEEDADKFIKGELTEKDAINYETDLCKVVYDLEVPQDLKITGFSGDEFNLEFAKIEDINYKFKWSQTDPEHSKWTTQFYCYEDFKYRLEGFFTSIGEWMYKEDYYLFYDDTDTYRCYWYDYFKKLAEGYVKKEETFGDYDYEILCTKVFIRNAWYDSDEGIQHYSNWIKVDIDFTSGEITTSFVELGGSEVEKDEDTGSLVIPEDNIIVDSDYTGSDYNGLMIQSSTDLVGWIKNGFGLTGENGVIVLMQDTFSFIPAELWYVFLTGISMFVLIAVVKWVRG